MDVICSLVVPTRTLVEKFWRLRLWRRHVLEAESVPALVLLTSVMADMLMQGRAALLVMLLVLVVRLCVELIGRSKRHLPLAIACIGLAVCAASLSSGAVEFIRSTTDDAFLLNDAYRGTGTGFVGRSERWHAAWEAFMAKPFFGQGFGYYAQTRVETAHNFYMYALVEFGMGSFFLLAFGAMCVWRITRSNIKLVMVFAPIFVLTIFNDRFIDLNPYPFVMFTIVLILACRGGNEPEGWFGKVCIRPR